MKKLVLISAILITISTMTNAQWYNQNSGTTDDLSQVFFVDEYVGYMAGGFRIYKTTDGGNIWTPISIIDSVGVKDLFFINREIGWFVFQDYPNFSGGVYKTTNGGITWNLQLTTIQPMNMGIIQFINPLNGWCLGIWSMANGRLYKTSDGGITWTDTLTDVNLAGGLFFQDINTGWIAGGTIEKTTDSGATWSVQLNIDPKYFDYIQFVNNDIGWAFSRGSWQETQIYKTTNSGQSWFLQTNFPFRRIRFFDESYGWALTSNSIYRTTNGGDYWELQYIDSTNALYDIFLISRNKGWVVGVNGTILTTNNGGIPVELTSFTSSINENDITLNWQTATETNNQGFEIQKKQAFGQQSSVSDQEWSVLGFVNGNGTTTEPQTYSFVDEGLQAGKYQYRLKQIDFDGTFEYSNTIEVEINSPTKFSLEQNYPNPFNPSTRIKFTIPFVETHLPAGRQGRDASLLTTLKVFDVLGNEIATLVNEEKPAGNFEVEFSVGASRRLAPTSGIYFYQLKAGNYVETKKMTLLK